jgi:hypothetical protein
MFREDGQSGTRKGQLEWKWKGQKQIVIKRKWSFGKWPEPKMQKKEWEDSDNKFIDTNFENTTSQTVILIKNLQKILKN